MCVFSVWRIRQIDFDKKVFTNASIHHTFYQNLLGSEQLQMLQICYENLLTYKKPLAIMANVARVTFA